MNVFTVQLDENKNNVKSSSRKTSHLSLPPPPNSESFRNGEGLLSKCSTKCLIAFTLCAIILVVMSSIFMAIMTTSILVRSPSSSMHHSLSSSNRELLRKNIEKYLTAVEPNPPVEQPPPSQSPPPNASSSTDNKLERNVFSWITDTIKKSFMGGEKKNSHSSSSSASLANILDINDMSDYPPGISLNMNNNPTFDQIMEFSRTRFRIDAIKPHAVKTRIMNGKEAKPNSWPWAVSIGLEGPREYVPHACGGTLINRRYVITAAHCVIQNSVFGLVGGPVRSIDKYSSVERMMRIYVGVHDRVNDINPNRVYSVERITIHQDFDPVSFKNDLALIRLDRDIDHSSHVGFVCLTGRPQGGQVLPGDTIYAIGWGYTEKSKNQASRYLMQVDLVVQRKENCLIQYIDNDQFCAGNIYERKDTCNGDSGGPLLKLVNKRWTLVGVVSNGDVTCSGTGIYINVPYFHDWIVSNSHY